MFYGFLESMKTSFKSQFHDFDVTLELMKALEPHRIRPWALDKESFTFASRRTGINVNSRKDLVFLRASSFVGS